MGAPESWGPGDVHQCAVTEPPHWISEPAGGMESLTAAQGGTPGKLGLRGKQLVQVDASFAVTLADSVVALVVGSAVVAGALIFSGVKAQNSASCSGRTNAL